MTGTETTWSGPWPECDFCRMDGKHVEGWVDGKTKIGPWAVMCRPHFRRFGVGLGAGRGQRIVAAS